MAGGLVPFGPQSEAIAVGMGPTSKCSWLCAKIEGLDVILNIEDVMETMNVMVCLCF